MQQPGIYATDDAVTRIQQVRDNCKQPDAGVRIAITGRSKGEFLYDLDLVFAGQEREGDMVINGPQGIAFYAPLATVPYLDGITLDADRLSGALKVRNPNPLWMNPLAEQVQSFLDEDINPMVAGLDLLDVAEGRAYIHMGAIALARRRGDRRWESLLRTASLIRLVLLGRWDEALVIAAEEEPLLASYIARLSILRVALLHCERGDREAARALLTVADTLRDSDNAQSKAGYAAVEARVLRAEGRPAEALASAERGLATLGELDVTDTSIKTALVEATEAALTLSNLDKAEELLTIPESLDPGQLTPFLQAQTARLRARLDAARGEQQGIDERFRSAASLFRECGVVFHLGVTQLEHAEWLTGQGRTDDAQPLLVEARETFEQLRATPWVERASRTSRTRREPAAAIS